jgi:uncharacterized damage-inducible protein DinB
MALIEVIRTVIEYNDALHRRMWESIQQLSDEQFVTEIDFSHGSVRNQMVHLAGVDGRWLRGLKELPDARTFRPAPADFPTRQTAFELWDGVSREVTEYANSIDEAALLYTPERMRGPRWQVLLHMVNHGTDHRAQVLRILHDFGAPTFDQDLILHLWRR